MSKSKKKKDMDEAVETPVKKATAGMGVDPHGPKKDGGDDDYEADRAMDDLMRAEEHKQNKDLMKRVGKKVGRKHRSIQSLKDTYNEKFGREATDATDDKLDEVAL
jgi:hypothetical protein